MTPQAGVTPLGLEPGRGGAARRDPRAFPATTPVGPPAAASSLAGLGPSLTPRQTQILSLIARGLTNKEIALALGISQRTVKFHVAALFGRLGASSRTEALVEGLRLGIIQIDSL